MSTDLMNGAAADQVVTSASVKTLEDSARNEFDISWCKHCVFGKGQSHPHYAKDKEEEGMPCISWDYMYMKGDGSKYEEEEDLIISGGTLHSMKLYTEGVFPSGFTDRTNDSNSRERRYG